MLSKSSSSADLCTDSAVSVCLPLIVEIVSITSFIMTSCELGTSDEVFDFFCKVYFSPNVLRKYVIVLTLNEMSLPGLICCDA